MPPEVAALHLIFRYGASFNTPESDRLFTLSGYEGQAVWLSVRPAQINPTVRLFNGAQGANPVLPAPAVSPPSAASLWQNCWL
jgi:hypothetical protein